MGVRQIRPAQIKKLTAAFEAQGVDVERRKDGLWLRLPNGDQTGIHFTPSDIKGNRLLYSRLRRAGVVHPDDPRGLTKLPPYITERGIDKESKRKLIEWYIREGYPKEVLSQDVKAALWPSDPAKANRALYHTGFRPEDRIKGKQRRVWIAPDDLRNMAPIPTPAMFQNGAVHPLVSPAPGSIAERLGDQLKDLQRVVTEEPKPVPAGSHPTKQVNRNPKPDVELTIAHKEELEAQGAVVPKGLVKKPKRAYTEIERALAAQGKTLEDLEHVVVEAATTGTPGEIVDAQAEQISALKQHAEALEEDLEQTAADEGSLADQLEKANEVMEEQRLRNQALAEENARLSAEVDQAMQIASDAEAALQVLQEADHDRKMQVLDDELTAVIGTPDERNSWSVDLDELLGVHISRMVRERLEVLRVVGLEYEFRVWRKQS